MGNSDGILVLGVGECDGNRDGIAVNLSICSVGNWEGSSVGISVGNSVGNCVGNGVGNSVGSSVGNRLGSTVGKDEKRFEGEIDNEVEGSPDEKCVGKMLISSEGRAFGISVGNKVEAEFVEFFSAILINGI